MRESILHWIYHYYQLEGIPAYPSPFIPVDFYFLNWIDTFDLGRFRKEKHYIPRVSPAQSGLEYYIVGTEHGGTQLRREYWDGGLFHEAEASVESSPPSFDSWLEHLADGSRRLVEKAKRGDTTWEFRGIEKDDMFGDVYVVVSPGAEVVRASDLYLDMPLEIEYRIDVEMMRHVEQVEAVIDGDSRILHRRLRLTNWTYLRPEDVSDKLFDPDYIRGLEKAMQS